MWCRLGDDITGNKVKGAPGVTPKIGLLVFGSGHGVNSNTVERYQTDFQINGPMRKVSSTLRRMVKSDLW
jgi:hypothetical protein